MRPTAILAALFAVLLVAVRPPSAHAGLDAAWRAIPGRVPADSLPAVLRTMEARGAPGVRPGEAAYALGQFRYVRGEYAPAADAFLRAYARLAGADRAAARYAYALSTLALGNTGAARVAFQQVADEGGELRSLALLGEAQTWDAERQAGKAFTALKSALARDPGEAGPAALERYAALAVQFHREGDARTARTRLAREYPHSIEAARQGAVARPRGAPDEGRGPSRPPAP